MPSSSASRSTSSQSELRLCGSRPVVGSSRKRIRGPVDQRQRQVEAAPHPAGVAADAAVGRLGEPDALDQLVAARAALGLGHAVKGGLQAHVLAGGQVRVERRLLQRRADLLADLPALGGDVVAADAGAPAGQRQQRGQHQHGRRLAGAVGAEEAVDLAGVDVEVDPVDGPRALLELLDEALDLDRPARSAAGESLMRGTVTHLVEIVPLSRCCHCPARPSKLAP